MREFFFGLNTSTIQPAGLLDKIRMTAAAGYDAIELWINDVEKYVAEGHAVADVRKALDDAGLMRPSMISLRDWCEPDEVKFQQALEAAKRRLDTARELGVKRIVAGPPREVVPLELAVKRYGQLLDVSVDRGVPASVEFLGFVDGINTLEDAWAICAGAARAEGTITPDIWHMFRGGSRLETLDSIPADHLSVFHWNDCPAEPPREQQTDSHRVYPGDGIYPIKQVAEKLRAKNWHWVLSLELFNPSYWAQDLREVARIGLEKMKASVG
ncbi:MAG: sugar phosphate isomerase/epimerase [Pirellulales bacterium]|nr:sugar phosphate isomerase/epimerase [Pirellulales bacterium]